MTTNQFEGEDMPEYIQEAFESTAHTRCDACQAQAYTMAVNPLYKSELLFCMHHRKAHAQTLLDEGWEIVDDCQAMEQVVGVEMLPV